MKKSNSSYHLTADFHKNKNGFTIIEALVVLFIFILITLSFYSLMSVGIKYIQDTKNRLGSLAVANEKMEIVRNLQYNDIGVIGGDVSGNIPQDETVVENTRQYNVHTDVQYIDDPADGIGISDEVWFTDYKEVTIEVSWSSNGLEGKVELFSRFVPPGLETINPQDGILSVNIFSDQPGGSGISNSMVHIYNPETGINLSRETNGAGNVIFMGSSVTDSIQKYELTITKGGYETVATMPPYPLSPYNPIDVHASVVTGSMNVANVVQNKLAKLKVSTVDYLGEAIPNADFHITGGRKLGTQAIGLTLIYNTDMDTETNANGEKDFGSISPGQYTITLPTSITDVYEVIGIYPIDPFDIFSDEDINFEIKLASKSATSLMVTVLSDETDNPPISGAVVQLTNSLGYDVTQTTGDEGILFFPSTSDVFQSGTYHLKITAAEFGENNSDVTVNNGQLKDESIILTSS